MISLRDTSHPRAPVVTYALIVLNVLAYWYEVSLGDARLDRFLDLWGVVPRSLLGFFAQTENDPGILVTPLTSMYLHVSVLHLAMNMLYLRVFGAPVEQRLGRTRYLGFYTSCGLLAVAAQVLTRPDSPIPAVGASGAIAGLMAGYLVLRPGATIAALAPGFFFFPSVDVPAVLMLGLWLMSQLVAGLLAFGTGGSAGGAAWIAHLGGFLSGLLLVFIFRPRRRRTYHW